MPRGLRNWTYRDVITFLKAHEFEFSEEKAGSHEAWIRVDEDGNENIVDINVIKGGESYPIGTLKNMMGQSGIDEKEWREWVS